MTTGTGNGSSTNEPGFLIQLGETLQGAIVGVLDGTSTIFRSVVGTFKDSVVFAIRSTKEVSDEAGGAVTSSIKKTIEETRNISCEGTKVTFGFLGEVGRNFKTSTIGTIEGTHEVSVKAANTFGKTVVDLSQCAYDVSAKVGNIAKTAALNTIRGTAEIGEELFGKIKSGALGVINIEGLRLGKKKVTTVSPSPEEVQSN